MERIRHEIAFKAPRIIVQTRKMIFSKHFPPDRYQRALSELKMRNMTMEDFDKGPV